MAARKVGFSASGEANHRNYDALLGYIKQVSVAIVVVLAVVVVEM